MSVFINIREQDGADRLTDILLSTGRLSRDDIIYSPVMSIVDCPVDIDWADYSAVLLTSRHAVAALNKEYADCLGIFCVGQATKDELVRQGYNNIIYTAKEAQELVGFLAEYTQAKQLDFCYLRAKHISVDLRSVCDVSIDDYICYEARPVHHLSDAACSVFARAIKYETINIYVPFFSKRSVDLFHDQILASQIEGATNFITPLCISDSVLEYAQTIFRNNGKAANTPNMFGMRDICVSVL